MFEADIDVIIVAKNEERHIGEVLQALNKQTYGRGNIRIFVVDNNSSDSTAAIARQHGATLIQSSSTVAAARNDGARIGSASLIAYLDAHCIPESNWLEQLAEPFADHMVGACMGSLRNVCADPAVAEFAEHSTLSAGRLVAGTVDGLHSPWPWIITGNCMVRRSAFNMTGGFNEGLFRCEDTDLSWKLVELGYHLHYQHRAAIEHREQCNLRQFLRKHFNYGIGAAQLAHAYDLHGERLPTQPESTTRMAGMLDKCYRKGFELEKKRILSGAVTPPARHKRSQVLEQFRRPFVWSEATRLQINPRAVYWFTTGEKAITAMLDSPERYVFQDSGAIIVRTLSEGINRAETVARLKEYYDLDDATEIEADVDSFIYKLLDAKFLVARER